MNNITDKINAVDSIKNGLKTINGIPLHVEKTPGTSINVIETFPTSTTTTFTENTSYDWLNDGVFNVMNNDVVLTVSNEPQRITKKFAKDYLFLNGNTGLVEHCPFNSFTPLFNQNTSKMCADAQDDITVVGDIGTDKFGCTYTPTTVPQIYVNVEADITIEHFIIDDYMTYSFTLWDDPTYINVISNGVMLLSIDTRISTIYLGDQGDTYNFSLDNLNCNIILAIDDTIREVVLIINNIIIGKANYSTSISGVNTTLIQGEFLGLSKIRILPYLEYLNPIDIKMFFNETPSVLLGSSTIVMEGSSDDVGYTIPLPWSFQVKNSTAIDQISISSNSYIGFSGNNTALIPHIEENVFNDGLNYYLSATDNSVQRIHSVIEGTEGSRIFKIRYEGTYDSTSGTIDSPTLDWEVWFFEDIPSTIEIHAISEQYPNKSGLYFNNVKNSYIDNLHDYYRIDALTKNMSKVNIITNDSDNFAGHIIGVYENNTISYLTDTLTSSPEIIIDNMIISGTGGPITKSDIDLGNVDNTSDLDKPISTATQAALDTKQDILVSNTNIKTINGASVLGSGDIIVSANPPWSQTDEQGLRIQFGYANSGAGNRVVIGRDNNVNGWNWGSCIGTSNTLTGYYSHILGMGCITEAALSVVTGTYGYGHIDSSFVFGSSKDFSATSVNQSSTLLMECITVGTIPSLLLPIEVEFPQKNYFEILQNSTTSFSGNIIGNVDGNESVSFSIEGLVRCGATVTTCVLVGSTVTPKFTDASLAGCDISITSRNDTNRLEINITGVAGKTISWNGVIFTNEVR